VGQSEVVRLLLEDGRSNPSSLENYSIRYASFYGHIEIVRMLMNDVRVDPSAMGNIALVYASSSGQTDIVKLLLTDARVVKAGLGKAIIEARNNCNDDVVDLLMEIIMRAV
jgi:ankyrin repeat protein